MNDIYILWRVVHLLAQKYRSLGYGATMSIALANEAVDVQKAVIF